MIKIKGFTMPEIIITIAIVGVLAMASVPIYRGYVRKGMATEGKALLAEIHAAEQVHYSRNGSFLKTDNFTGNTPQLGVDARQNKYFSSYKITTGSNNTFTAIVQSGSSDKSLTLRGSLTAEPEIIDNFTKE